MLSLGGVHGTSPAGRSGRAWQRARRCWRWRTRARSTLTVEGGARHHVVQAGQRAGHRRRARSTACGWAAAPRPSASSVRNGWDHADEVIVVDDHITGVLTEHQAGRFLRPCGRAASGCGAAAPRRGATSRWPTPVPAGAARTSRTRSTIIERIDPAARLGRGLRLLHGLHHRRAQRLVRAGRRADAAVPAAMPAADRGPRSPGSARTASPRCAPCCSWRAPAARCGRAPRTTRCC